MAATPRWQPPFPQPSRTIAAAMTAITSICETPILREGEGCHVSASDRQSTGQTLVKLRSKLQKWLNKRGRIGNWTGINLLIN